MTEKGLNNKNGSADQSRRNFNTVLSGGRRVEIRAAWKIDEGKEGKVEIRDGKGRMTGNGRMRNDRQGFWLGEKKALVITSNDKRIKESNGRSKE